MLHISIHFCLKCNRKMCLYIKNVKCKFVFLWRILNNLEKILFLTAFYWNIRRGNFLSRPFHCEEIAFPLNLLKGGIVTARVHISTAHIHTRTLLQGLTWFSVTQTGCRWLISYMEQKKFLACVSDSYPAFFLLIATTSNKNFFF